MHGCNSGSALLVNAEVDSMGGIVDGGVGIGVKTSPRRAAIERAQAELRQEYDVREERRRELEFLEKGGNPLDFKFGNAASVSVQSTSLTDQQAEHFVTSGAKGSFAMTASPHGDSVESSGRPGIPAVCEPISADNLLLFDGENETPEGETKSMHSRKRNTVVPSVQSSQRDQAQNAKELEDSAIFRPYARRNRSKINRDGARSSSAEMVQGRGGHVSSLSARGSSKDDKDLTSETNNQKDKNMPPVNTRKSASSNGDLASKVIISDNQLNMELDGGQAAKTTDQSKGDLSKSKVDVTVPNEAVQVESHKTPVNVASEEPDLVGGKEEVVSTGSECPPGTGATKAENETIFNKLNGVGDAKRDEKDKPLDGKNSSATRGMKGLDSESSCTENSLSLDVNNDNGVFINPKNVDSKGNPTEQTSNKEEPLNLAVGDLSKENSVTMSVDNVAIICDTNTSLSQKHSLNISMVKVEEKIRSELQNELNCPSNNEVQQSSHPVAEADGKTSSVWGDNSNSKSENISTSRPLHTTGNFLFEIPERTSLGITSTTNTDVQTSLDNHVKVVDKAHEDSILEEARIIEAKRKRIAELSAGTLTLANQRKSHWDFVLEEMTWLANDFAQERLWKMTAAAQLCRRAAFTSQLKFEEQNQFWKLKGVALTLANAVMEFWHSAEMFLNSKDRSLGLKNSGHDLVGSRANDVTENKNAELDMGMNKEHPGKANDLAIRAYALRFLKYSSSPVPGLQAEAPATPDRISDAGIIDIPWNEHLTEESLFYSVPSGAVETYRRSIESYLVQNEKTGSSAREEVEVSACDDGAEFGYGDFVCDEDEEGISTYYLPGAFEDRKSSKQNKKKRKNPMKSYPARPYETGADLPYGNCAQQSMLIGKRPGSSLNVGSIPTKRVRTGSRQRVLSPFSSAAAAGGLQAPMKTDASSGDTNSFQDDQGTLQGGFQIQKGMEVESTGDFERQQPYHYAETPAKPKKKKAKNLGSAYDQGWQLESTFQNEQRDYSKKRSESHHFDSNGSNVLYGQHNAKKLKVMKQQPDNAFDIIPSGSIPSPVGTQMSNMSNPNKIIRLIHGRDRGRKAKTPKMSAGEPGYGCPWSLFEDQALVVLVHDMGPNWELVSDAINSTLQFKCIFRNPKECKERHKILMDRSGDGADSADDSGSSQSYPSTLPGIPKGSARQLFQRLQGPMEEDALKSHFEKIIHIGKKQQHRQSQHDNQNSKQIVPVHNSHVIALSQVCPNNLNGGVLTPLDICDVTASSQDVLPLGYQASHTSGLAISNQGAVGSIPPTSGANSSVKGSSGMVLGNNLASLSTPLSASVRDGRYGVPRTSFPAGEQHRMQQYNQMLSSRNIQQSNLSLPGAVSGSDRMVCMLPGGNNLGMMGGINRGMSLSRPGFQGMTSSAVLNSSSMHSNLVGMPSPVNMHSGPGSGQGNSMLRSRDTKHMMRPGNSPEPQRQLMVPELQMQAQGNSQGIPAFNGLNSAYPNQSTTSVQSYPGHPQQQQQMPSQQSHALGNSHHSQHQGSNHATGPQQQAYAMRIGKERQMQQQQRLLQQQQPQKQQQQQFAASSALMPHVQPPTQLPISSSLQNSSQIQSQTATQPVSIPPPSSPLTPMSLQHQQKHHLSPHGLGRNHQTGASGLNNQVGKQWQRQPQQQQQQQSGRQHPQQRQQTQSQQKTKLLKGVGRGNVPVHQNLSTDPADLSGLCMASSNQTAEKGEQITNLMQDQGLCPGPGTNPVQQSKPLVSQPQQKQFSGATPPSTKQLQQIVSHSDNSSQGQVSTLPSDRTPSAVNQCILPVAVGPNPQHLHLPSQPHQKKVNQNQYTVQRVLQQNRPVNYDPPSKSQAEPTQADQQQMNNASQMGTTATTAVSQSGIDSANTVQNLSSVGSQWKASEPVYNPGMPIVATQMGSVGSPPLTNSAASVPGPSVSKGIAHRQSSGGLLPHGKKAGTQQPQQPQIQQSPTPAPSQQHYQPQEQLQHDLHNSSPQQLPLQQQSQQQIPQLQAVQGSLYHRPSSSKLE
ncbi:chromatin modification-related protein EAF1 B-like isoform X1 [Hibiscus syriacus]|uniref:chromatin modification-related protein EAF1 B-like isoform X1 n=1 Tax=Hibiscus syriacus TaxID=106335 RepID=UPI001922CC97|nr:chromatin modification-related protein EAF1 B-like isoform X1 [Hibiscus syriacus]XP_039039387.1 chromatin modification-related protein EAF1 B-like isoform X1 [Hibiscus syriacus]